MEGLARSDARGRLNPERALLLLPGVAAFGLAVLYTLGAVLLSGELRGADLRISDALPLIPLEQVLARGIGTAVVVGLATPLFVLVFLAVEGLSRRARAQPRASAVEADESSNVWLVGRLVGYPISLASPLLLPLVSIAVVVCGVLALLLVESLWEATISARSLFAAGAATVAFSLLASGFFNPPPLADVSIEREHGTAAGGKLVAATGDSWYVAAGKGRIRAIPADQVRVATIRPVEDYERDESLLELVTGWNIF